MPVCNRLLAPTFGTDVPTSLGTQVLVGRRRRPRCRSDLTECRPPVRRAVWPGDFPLAVMRTIEVPVLPVSTGDSIDVEEEAICVSGGSRLDITGLRGLAVLLVTLSRLCGWPRGGFVAVDVLLVLSGYCGTYACLCTRSTSACMTGRARQVWPVLLIVLGVTSAAGPWLSDGSEVRWVLFSSFHGVICRAACNLLLCICAIDDVRQNLDLAVLATVFLSSNWWFLSHASVDLSHHPLLHCWCLSIEEQFYLVWPWLLFYFTQQATSVDAHPAALDLVEKIPLVGSASSTSATATTTTQLTATSTMQAVAITPIACDSLVDPLREQTTLHSVLDRTLFLTGVAVVMACVISSSSPDALLFFHTGSRVWQVLFGCVAAVAHLCPMRLPETFHTHASVWRAVGCAAVGVAVLVCTPQTPWWIATLLPTLGTTMVRC
jgi:peptidoglycan/LPS O-acetylase OafA/YrhL